MGLLGSEFKVDTVDSDAACPKVPTLISLENTAAIQAPEEGPEVDKRRTPDLVGNNNLLAGMALQFPGDVVQASLEGEQGFDQSHDREQLALRAPNKPRAAGPAAGKGADATAVVRFVSILSKDKVKAQ